MTKLRVFLADDHAVVLEGLKSLINAQADMEVVGDASDGLSAVREAQRLEPDVVVVDVSMPKVGGARATEMLKQARPAVKVLALTVHEDTSYLRQLLQAGVSGYVLKRAAADDLIQAIRIVAAGGTYLDPSLAGKLVTGFVRGTSSQKAAAESLSEREEEVLRLVARGHTNKEIAASLDISIKTVETYKSRSMEKLNLGSRAAIVSYAAQHGWLGES